MTRWIACFPLLLSASQAVAHPHVFVDSALRIETDAARHVTGVELSWAYDEFFTLLIFECAGPEATARLTSVLDDRLRDTDEAGWIDQDRVAILLPETGHEGADVLAADLGELLGVEADAPKASICCYPTDAERFAEVFGEPYPPSDDDPDPPAPLSSAPPRGERRTPATIKGPGAMDALFVRPVPFWKRAVDVTASGLLLIIASPLFLLIALAIKLDSRGPVLFRQPRAGRGGQPFVFLKFRSMIQEAEGLKSSLLHMNEQDGPIFKMDADPRITRLGRFLRKTSLDELPQLWNVLRGDMSLVGPRPPTLDEVPNYEPWQRRRLEVQGGITGLWQVSGRSTVRWPQFVRMDLRYIEQRSLWTDLKILCLTVPAVLSGRGAK